MVVMRSASSAAIARVVLVVPAIGTDPLRHPSVRTAGLPHDLPQAHARRDSRGRLVLPVLRRRRRRPTRAQEEGDDEGEGGWQEQAEAEAQEA